MEHSVSVIIPNYNGKNLLEEYLPSVLAALKHTKADYEIIVSDDASTDDSVKFIRENYPEIIIVESKINQGFSHTINSGIKIARKHLALLLNSDVKLKEDYFEPQWKYFEKPDTFGVMGSIWSEDARPDEPFGRGKRLMDAAKYPVWKGGQLRSTINYSLKERKGRDILTLFLSGANALVDRKKLIELQGMDPRYSPFYMEDVDLSVRAWRKGWKCYYEPDAMCYHKLSETISTHNSKKKVSYISKRNKFIFHDTHLEGGKRLLWNIENAFNLLVRWLAMDFSYYKSYFEYKKIKKVSTSYPRMLESVTEEILEASKNTPLELF